MCLLFNSFMYSQNADHTSTGFFTKTIEFNRSGSSKKFYNLSSKTDAEKLLFGDFNAPIEFFYEPCFSGDGIEKIGFRILKDSLEKNYFFEIKFTRKKDISFVVSNQFAEKMLKNMYLFINNFKATVSPITQNNDGIVNISMIFDGDSYSFRTVVGVELWSLKIHSPSGNAQKMADLCLQMINETISNNKFDEKKYIKLLDDFNFGVAN